MDAIAKAIGDADSTRIFDAEREKAAIVQTGFIAQEVEVASKELGFDFSGVDAPKSDQDHYGIRYAEFTVPLVKAVQELHLQLEEERSAHAESKAQIANLEKQLESIKSALAEIGVDIN